MMRENEAATKLCPIMMPINRNATCLGSRCMAWRWRWNVEDKLDSKGRRTGRTTGTPTDGGYCGMAGRPEP